MTMILAFEEKNVNNMPIKSKKKGIYQSFLLIVLVLAALLLSGCSEQSVEAEKKPAVEKADNEIIYDDDVISAEFCGFDDNSELEIITVKLRVTNKTDQKIWVYLDEASLNGTMMQLVMTGTPLYIMPGKSGTNGFIFYLQQAGIKSVDEIQTVSFKIGVKNEETLADIELTKEITLNR